MTFRFNQVVVNKNSSIRNGNFHINKNGRLKEVLHNNKNWFYDPRELNDPMCRGFEFDA
jgi:hypothetical protein